MGSHLNGQPKKQYLNDNQKIDKLVGANPEGTADSTITKILSQVYPHSSMNVVLENVHRKEDIDQDELLEDHGIGVDI